MRNFPGSDKSNFIDICDLKDRTRLKKESNGGRN